MRIWFGKTQGGRSMIEMLGVLAIIGVLSAGGIMGYTSAMENYKVNKTIDAWQNMVMQSNYVFNRKESFGLCFHATELCPLNIMPEAWCKARTSIDYITGYLGEGIYFNICKAGGTTSVIDYDETSNFSFRYTARLAGDVRKLKAGPCVKLLSSDAWREVSQVAWVSKLGSSSKFRLPIKAATATNFCKAQEKAGGFFTIFALLNR